MLIASTVEQSNTNSLRGVSYEVIGVTRHPMYDVNTGEYDVALLTLDPVSENAACFINTVPE